MLAHRPLDGRAHIGAHYDATRLPDGSLSRGAVDNATSSVILIQLAETRCAEKMPFKVGIIGFDLEQLGLVGSPRYLKTRGAAGIRAMINMDINGYADTVLFGRGPRG
jgi:Zn-dependent M28 family amino/carboxypeptidase